MEFRRETRRGQKLQIASGLVFDRHGRLLLLRRHPDDFGGGMWGFPGGKIESHEDPGVTATREVEEETGLRLADWKPAGSHEVSMPHGTVHLLSFESQLDNTPEIVLRPEEHSESRWFDVDELPRTPLLVWGIPTIMHDLGYLDALDEDTTLADGSTTRLIEKY
jgi:8-oxo-dGTP diphosphatase